MRFKFLIVVLLLNGARCTSEVYDYRAVESLSVTDYQITTASAPAAPQVNFTPTNASVRDFSLSLVDTATTVVALSGNTIVPRSVGSAQIRITSLDGGATATFTVTVSDGSSTTSPTLTQKLRGIWLVGGLSTGIATPIAAVDMYDPVTATWYPAVTTVPTPVSFMAVASVENKIYVIGGFDATGTPVGNNQEYDIATDTWTARAALAPARANIYGTTIQGKIAVLGGGSANASSTTYTSGTTVYTTTAEYTPGGAWGTKVAFGLAGTDRNHVAYGGVLYNMGGRTAAITSVATHAAIVWTDNVLSGTAPVAMTAFARSGFSLAVHSSSITPARIFVIGGITTAHTGCAHFILNAPCTYTPVTTVQFLNAPFVAPNAWTAASSLPTSRAYGGAAVYGNTIYYFGGNNSAAVGLGETSVYSIDATTLGAWTTLSAMPRGRWGHAAVTINP